MDETTNPNMVPRGRGGVVGHVLRMILTVFTAGMAYPNSFVEGMDLTAIQRATQGKLYDKNKGASAATRF
jgi:hypothetical protein